MGSVTDNLCYRVEVSKLSRGGQMIIAVGFVDLSASVTTTQLCCCGTKAAVDKCVNNRDSGVQVTDCMSRKGFLNIGTIGIRPDNSFFFLFF